jgi:hypothetical protein
MKKIWIEPEMINLEVESGITPNTSESYFGS